MPSSLRRALQWVYRHVYKWRFLVSYVLLPFHALEYAVLLLPHLRDIRSADAVYPVTFGAFGHQATEPHLLAMSFRGKKLLIILSDYKNFNPYILASFRGIVDIRYLRHSFPSRFAWNRNFGITQIRTVKSQIFRFLHRFVKSRAVILDDFAERDSDQVTGSYAARYIHMMHSDRNIDVYPIQKPIKEFRSLMERTHPELRNRWFVTLYLRRKRRQGTDVRDTDPEPYRAAVEYVISLGGFVLCGGDCDPHGVFPDLKGIYGYRDFPCSRFLCDFFFLTQPKFLICGHSGPIAIATLFNVPALITNNAFFYLAGYRANQFVLWKQLRDKRTGRLLRAAETFSRPVVAYIENEPFEAAGLEHVDNSTEQLLQATEEMVSRFVRKVSIAVGNEDRALIEHFRHFLPEGAVARISPSSPVLNYLRSLEW